MCAETTLCMATGCDVKSRLAVAIAQDGGEPSKYISGPVKNATGRSTLHAKALDDNGQRIWEKAARAVTELNQKNQGQGKRKL